MKKNTVTLLLLISLNVIAQKKTKIFFEDFVECFHPYKTTESIFIYNSPNENKIAELSALTEPHCWYKFAISESKDGWLKIENMLVLPACDDNELNKNIGKYKGKWIKAKNLKINIGHSGEIKIDCLKDKTDKGFAESGYRFYSEPTINSEIEFCINGYVESELIEINGTWAKLKIEYDGQLYIGWIQKKYQCAYPWTTCPVYD
ncbi:hypothetical protein [uncultured Algibacter sp.]|uniref:hypothetical protein n=1 Tax=uncultured Algibacter sp. TaxID=298659 RepID=UPI002637F3A5|nr:hypothetical protein [uncultured Algibacter sp.]